MKPFKPAGYALLTALLVALPGCGGGTSSSTVEVVALAAPVRDAYMSAVQTTTTSSSEDKEAAKIDALTVTTSEDTEAMNL